MAGLAYGKLGFISNGLLISAENASRSDWICACKSGWGHTLLHFSRMRMCLVKYSLASVLYSGSGEVMAAYDVSTKSLQRRRTYQVQHCRSQYTINGKVDSWDCQLESSKLGKNLPRCM